MSNGATSTAFADAAAAAAPGADATLLQMSTDVFPKDAFPKNGDPDAVWAMIDALLHSVLDEGAAATRGMDARNASILRSELDLLSKDVQALRERDCVLYSLDARRRIRGVQTALTLIGASRDPRDHWFALKRIAAFEY